MSELGPQAKELVAFIRARSGPTEADAMRVELALHAKIAATTAVAVAAASKPSAALSMSVLGKLVVGAALLGGLGTFAYVFGALPLGRSEPVAVGLARQPPLAPAVPSAAPTALASTVHIEARPDLVPSMAVSALPSASSTAPKSALGPEDT